MARIATCKCGIEFYDSTEKRSLCNRCERETKEKTAKLIAVKSFYEGLKRRRGGYNLNWAVIQCLTREKMTIPETAEVLGDSEDRITFEWEIARQNAR